MNAQSLSDNPDIMCKGVFRTVTYLTGKMKSDGLTAGFIYPN